MTPSIGRIVYYRLSDSDAHGINSRRDHGGASGNKVNAGEVVPMIIVKVWSDDYVNGQAFLDGEDSLWTINVVSGDEPGQWSWPLRV